VRELHRDNLAIRKDNQALQEEIAKVRSGRSSLASGSQVGLPEPPRTNSLAQREGTPVNDTPLSKKWAEMDEIQYEGTPQDVLETILREKRNRRLAQAGLPSSDNTVVPPRTYKQVIGDPKFANLSFTRGNTFKRNEGPTSQRFKAPSWAYDKWENWPSKIPEGRINYDSNPRVAVARELPRSTGRYRIAGEHEDTMYAEIRTRENPEYEHTADNPPEIPAGYTGGWVVTQEDPPPVMGSGRSRQAFYALIVLKTRQLTGKTLAWTGRRPLLCG